ncbi:amidohydrolase family protein [Actinomadura flavalba]|uniref:amidohydrolase family protein n=1 Tax=Actinomadura flavalba TaxID=1120938 RepID=UPI000374ECBE|nr:amidohydrolase family protein [Actinomadura flavalba]
MTAPLTDEDVPAFWGALGLPGLIDAHVHFMPPRLMESVWAYFDEPGPLIGRHWPIVYREPEDARVERLRAFGVRAFTALLYPHRPGMAAGLNAWALEFAARVPEAVPTGTLFPEPGVAAYVERAIEDGVRAFKVHLQVGGFDPRAPELDAAWGVLAEAAVPVVVHAGSGPVAHGFTGPEPFGAVLTRHPGLTAVVAHLGAPEYDGFFALAETYSRVHLDTTMAFTRFFEEMGAFPPALLPRLRDLGESGRVLLGTDFPNIPYPYAHQLQALAGLGFGDAWLREVCWHAPARVLGVG